MPTATRSAFTTGAAAGVLEPISLPCRCDGRRPSSSAAADRIPVTSPEEAAAVLAPLLRGRDREHCVAAFLDTKHRLMTTTVVSIGSIDHTFMHPREILRDALLANASAMVLAHNHPSGDATPSDDDRAVTRRIAQAARLMGVELLDHIVVGDQTWTSLARQGEV